MPQSAPIHSVVLTYWRSTADCADWHESPASHQLADLGTIRSTLYVIIPEWGTRLGLRTDRLQRQWVAKD